MILIDSWPYDLMVSGELKFASEITDDPVESGGSISDNVRPLPVAFSLEAIVSDSPIGDIANHESRRVDDVSEAVFGSDMVPLPSAEAYERLLEIRKTSKLVTIEIPVASRSNKPGKLTFDNMALEELSVPMSADTAGGLTFSASWKQVTLIENKRVTVRVAAPAARPRAAAKVAVGQGYRVDQRVLWVRGQPAGAPVTDKSPWCVVEVTWSDGKGGPGAKATYRFSGEASPDIQDDCEAGVELLSFERTDFFIDLGRAQAAKTQAQITERRKLLETPKPDLATAQKNLPPGVDLSRFQKPATTIPTVK